MIIFYPPVIPVCVPVIIADMTDSSDQWSAAEIMVAVLQNVPAGITASPKASIFSCKYDYMIQHNGIPISEGLRMTMNAAIKTPPADLIAQMSIDFVLSLDDLLKAGDAADKIANPQVRIMTAVVVERTAKSTMSRSFIAYASVLQPDSLGTTATLFIRAASLDDAILKSALGFQLDTVLPLRTQLETVAASMDYSITFDAAVGMSPPVSGKLFQPSTLPKILSEICLQNKLIPSINGKTIKIYTQTDAPVKSESPSVDFSFLGSVGAIAWGVGIENYTNVKFKTSLFDSRLFDPITFYNDSGSAMFTGLKKKSLALKLTIPAYEMYIIRYVIERSDQELIVEVTATNNWLLSQVRVDGILESSIYGVGL